MTKYNTIPNDDEALLATKQRSLKGLVVGAALVSFALGALAATAGSPAGPMDAVNAPVMQTKATTNAKTVPLQMSTKACTKDSQCATGMHCNTVHGTQHYKTCVKDAAPPSKPSGKDWWQDGSTNWRTVSVIQAAGDAMSYHKSLNLAELKKMVDKLHKDGVTAFTLNSAYDSGAQHYNPEALWNGLAMSDPMKVNPLIGSDKDFKSLANYVHGKGMKLMTWWNPSYIWTGAPLFKQAEADMRKAGGDVSRTPSDSPARFFKWGPLDWGSGVTKPADDEPPFYPDSNDDTRDENMMWVTDADAGASYLTRFGMQPCADFSSKAWQKKFRAIAQHWIDMGVDGFVLDDPSGYIGAGSVWGADDQSWANVGYDGGKTMRSAVTGVIRELSGGKVAAFGEIYEDSDETLAYGLDGAIVGNGDHDTAVSFAVANADASGLEDAFGGTGSADSMIAMCAYTDTVWCPISWMRPSVSASGLRGVDDQWGQRVSYNCYPGAGADGYESHKGKGFSLDSCFALCKKDSKCETITFEYGWQEQECWLRGAVDVDKCDTTTDYTTFSAAAPELAPLTYAISAGGGIVNGVEISGPATFWSADDWPGMAAAGKAMRALKGSVFKPLALRQRLKTTKKSAWAVLNYDALFSGDAGVAVYNLADKPATVSVDITALPPAIHGKKPIDLVTGKTLAPFRSDQHYDVELPARGYAFLGGIELPEFKSQGHLNCYGDGHGASWAPEPGPDYSGDVSLAACFNECNSDVQCSGITVNWVEDGKVKCWLRGGLDLKKCDSDDSFTTFTRSN